MKCRFIFLNFLFFLSSCSSNRTYFEPHVAYVPVERDLSHLQSAFAKITEVEMQEAWAQELHVGRCFAKELDFYRAITSFKKALYLINGSCTQRIYEIEYDIIQSYFLAGRYTDVANTFSSSQLQSATPSTFAAFHDLMIILWETFRMVGECEKADKLYELIEKNDCELSTSLSLYLSLSTGNIHQAEMIAKGTSKEKAVDNLAATFYMSAKSPKKAEILNAVLPGAGYWYVGEKRSAVTSFVINALFGWAAYRFFDEGYVAAGLITLSLEAGWYIGGINGAALEAKYYNERLYHQNAECMMTDALLFPALMLDYSF